MFLKKTLATIYMTADFNKWTDENHGFFAMFGMQLLSGKKKTHIVEVHTAINPLNTETFLVESYKVTEIKYFPPNFQEGIAKSLSRSTPINPVVCVLVYGIIAGQKTAKFMSLGSPGLLGIRTDLTAEQLVHNFNKSRSSNRLGE
jgi:hypothetical protein